MCLSLVLSLASLLFAADLRAESRPCEPAARRQAGGLLARQVHEWQGGDRATPATIEAGPPAFRRMPDPGDRRRALDVYEFRGVYGPRHFRIRMIYLPDDPDCLRYGEDLLELD